MNDNFRVWTQEKPNSVEGHTYNCTLTFNDKTVWGPVNCHSNTIELANAIRKGEKRFYLELTPRSKSVEGHTRYISVMSKGVVTLDKLSTHSNMDGMVSVMQAILAVSGHNESGDEVQVE